MMGNLKALQKERRAKRQTLKTRTTPQVVALPKPEVKAVTSVAHLKQVIPEKTPPKQTYIPPRKYGRLKEFSEMLQNPDYADSGDYADDLLDFADSNGMPLKSAYDTFLTADKKAEYKLNADQLYVAKMSGMTPSEYLAYM
jgi:hypothetical protein